MLKVQMHLKPAALPDWQPALEAALAEAGIVAELATDHPPEEVDYVIYAPSGGHVDLSGYTRTKLVHGLWAGVESIIGNDTLTQPYARMVGGGLTQGMVEWVTGNVLRHHLGLDRYITADAPHWDQVVPPLASERRVTILGLGELGAASAAALVHKLAGSGEPTVDRFVARVVEDRGFRRKVNDDLQARAVHGEGPWKIQDAESVDIRDFL